MNSSQNRSFVRSARVGGAALAVPALVASGLVAGSVFVGAPTAANAALAPVATQCSVDAVLAFNDQKTITFTTPDGQITRKITAQIADNQSLGDIAFDTDGNLWAINQWDQTLFRIDQQTGAVLETITYSGLSSTGPSGIQPNALGMASNGTFWLGQGSGQGIFTLDPVTRVVTRQAELPNGQVSGGDFFNLPDGALFAVSWGSNLYRYDQGNPILMGSVPMTWGAARVGNEIFLGTSNGNTVKFDLTNIQLDANGQIITEPYINFGHAIWGATSTTESLAPCPVVHPDQVTADQGQSATLTPDYDAGTDPASAEFVREGQPAGAVISDDGKTLTIAGTGTWAIQPDGTTIFTPDAALVGNPPAVLYSANTTDGTSSSPGATLEVFYPDVTDVAGAGNQGQPVTVPAGLGEGVDPTSVQLIDPATGQPTDGTVDVPGEGSWSVDQTTGALIFTPLPDFIGNPAPQQYTAALTSDPNATAIPATVTVTYPDVADVSNSGDQGQPVTVAPDLGDNVDPTTVVFVDDQGNRVPTITNAEGTWTIDPATGDMTFTPADGFQGDPTPVLYTAESVDGGFAEPATVTVTYPDVADNAGSGNQGDPVTVAPVADTSIDLTTVQLIDPTTGLPTDAPVVIPGQGTWTVDPTTGAVTFTPLDGFVGSPAPIGYTAQDAAGNQAEPATITVTYPDVSDVSGSGDQGTPVTVPTSLGEGIDPTTVQLIDPETGLPTDAPVDVPNQGTWTVDPTTGAVTFTPVDGFQGNPTPVEYTAQDADGNQAEPATVTVTYPDVSPVIGSGDQGTPVTVPADLGEGVDPTTVQLIDPGTGQPTDAPVVIPNEGTWTVDPETGDITFTPEPGFDGDPTPVNYTAQDAGGNQAEPASVTITYPDITPLVETGDQGQPVTVVPGLTDGMDPTTVVLIDPNTGEPTKTVETDQGTWTVDEATGEITFTPADGFQGDPDPIFYTAEDENGDLATPATVTITYPDVNDVTGSGDQGTPVSVPADLDEQALPNTVQLIDPITGEPTREPVIVPGEGTWTVDPNTGVITFDPEDTFTGDPTPIEYIAEDADGNVSEPATVTVTYPDVDDVTGSGDEGTPVSVTPDLGDTIDPTTVQLIDPETGQPTDGPVEVPGEGTWTVDPNTGVITFTPEDGFDGDPTPIEYTAQDGDGNVATPATVTVTYPNVDDVTGTGEQGTPVSVPPALDEGTDPTTVVIIDPDSGEPTKELVVPGEGTWTVDPDTGVITFTPEDGFQDDPTPVKYTAEDGDGNVATPGTVTVDYPDVDDVTGSGDQGTPVSVTPVVDEDTDPTTVQIIDPNTGEPTTDPVIVPGEGTWTVDPDTGVITFTPEDGFDDQPTPIEYIAEDGDGNPSQPGTVTVTYPDADDNTGTGTPGTPVTVPPVLDPGSDPTTVEIIDPNTGEPTRDPVVVPGEGTWTVDPNTGEVTFTPEDGFDGDPTPIEYVVHDEDGNVSTPATITVTYSDPDGQGGNDDPNGNGNGNGASDPQGGGLAQTGGEIALGTILAGAGLAAAGFVLALFRRRRNTAE